MGGAMKIRRSAMARDGLRGTIEEIDLDDREG